MTFTTESGNQDFIVFLNESQTTVVRDEGGDLLAVLDELNTDALTNSGVRLLSFNTPVGTRLNQHSASRHGNLVTYTFSRTIPLA